MCYKAVLFDLDGTLLDSLSDLAESVNVVLARHRLPVHPADSYRYFVGDGARNLVRRALPEHLRDTAIECACLSEYREEYGRRWNQKSKAYDGVLEMLSALRKMGVKTAILSNKPDNFTRMIAKELFYFHKFDAVFGEREGTPRKPDPAGALDVAKALKLEPSEILYVGDSGVDMQTASAAGMYGIGVLWGFRTREELENSGARMLAESTSDIMKLFTPCTAAN